MGQRRLTDLSGNIFGHLVVSHISDVGLKGRRHWICNCDCGSKIRTTTRSLINGSRTCCGCQRPKREQVRRSDREPFGGLCCIKGCDREVQGHNFCRSHYEMWRNNGHPLHTRQKCVAVSTAKTATKEYKTWHGAKQRCTSPANRQYPNYGGRGIRMCDAWLSGFDAFIADMGKAPTRDHSLDRIDVNGNYEPSNCRWATASEQSRNTRSTRLTPQIVAVAKKRFENGGNAREIANDLSVPYQALRQALDGKSWVDITSAMAA